MPRTGPGAGSARSRSTWSPPPSSAGWPCFTFRHAGRGGRIVNVASRAAWRGDSPAHWHYAASKGGMVAMTKSIARAYARENILAFAVCPGFTMTGMADDYLASRGGDKLLADIPLGRVAETAEVAETVRWLACQAPPSATGTAIDVNGASYRAMSWKVTLPCTKPEAEALTGDIAPLATLDSPPVLMTSEPDPARPDQWRMDAYFEIGAGARRSRPAARARAERRRPGAGGRGTG